MYIYKIELLTILHLYSISEDLVSDFGSVIDSVIGFVVGFAAGFCLVLVFDFRFRFIWKIHEFFNIVLTNFKNLPLQPIHLWRNREKLILWRGEQRVSWLLWLGFQLKIYEFKLIYMKA